jgi:hypothetical protein
MAVLEQKSYWEFCNILDSHLERVAAMEKQYGKLKPK